MCTHTHIHGYRDRQAGRWAGSQVDRQTDRPQTPEFVCGMSPWVICLCVISNDDGLSKEQIFGFRESDQDEKIGEYWDLCGGFGLSLISIFFAQGEWHNGPDRLRGRRGWTFPPIMARRRHSFDAKKEQEGVGGQTPTQDGWGLTPIVQLSPVFKKTIWPLVMSRLSGAPLDHAWLLPAVHRGLGVCLAGLPSLAAAPTEDVVGRPGRLCHAPLAHFLKCWNCFFSTWRCCKTFVRHFGGAPFGFLL